MMIKGITDMTTLAAQEIKRRGIGAVDDLLEKGPVHIIRNNKPQYVVMSEYDYIAMLEDAANARITAAERDWEAGRIHRGSAAQLLAEIDKSDKVS